MTSVLQPTDQRSLSTSGSIIFDALRQVTLLWIVAFVGVTTTVYWLASDWVADTMIIATASWLISVGALISIATLPYLLSADTSAVPEPGCDQSLSIPSILIAMAIRMVGTVALFLFCRYQMGLPPQMIALMVCGWYVLLTSLEVSLLAHGAKSLTSSTESTSE